jgi:adenylate kinase
MQSTMASSVKLLQRNIVLFGAPGVGKGTYGKLISKEFNIPAFSMGDYFRKVINDADRQSFGESSKQNQFVTQLRETLSKGHFVSDELAIEVIKQARFGEFKDTEFLMLDGMPRTVEQAEMMEGHLSVDVVFNFLTREDILLEKLMGRRICPLCNRNYNCAHIDRDGYYMKALLPEKSPEHCGSCGNGDDVPLIMRDDDKESIILERMEIYKQKTEPILDYYRARSETRVIDFDPKKGVDDFPKIKEMLDAELAKF